MKTHETRERLGAIFARISEEEKNAAARRGTAQVDSPETQVRRCSELAQTHGIPVASENSGLIVKAVHSGTDLLWAGSPFMALVRRARQHEFTDLFCLNVDRFCRGGSDAFRNQLALLEQEGIQVHFVQSPLPADLPFRNSMLGFYADGAKYWRDGIVEATVRTRTAYAENGNFIPGNTPPFGWQFVEHEKDRTARGWPVKVGLVPNDATSPALLHMYEHVADGGSVRSLKLWLEGQSGSGNDTPYPTPKGAPVWHENTIRSILHNPTNWGERKSFATHRTPREEGVNRPATLKTRTKPESGAAYDASQTVLRPIPGLTKDLALRALARLAEKREMSPRRAMLSEEERVKRALLFGGMVQCSVCGGGMRVKHHNMNGGWTYICSHTGTAHEKEPSISMLTKQLDAFAWQVAVGSIEDPAFLERLARATEEESGALAHAKALQHTLDEATAEHARFKRQWDKLDPDNPDEEQLWYDKKREIQRVKARIAELIKALEASRALVEEDEQRRASLTAFRAYAEAERPKLEQQSPIERHQMLRALRTRAKLYPDGHYPRLRVAFDIRHLPGAIERLGVGAEHPGFWSDRDYTFSAESERLVNEDEVPPREPEVLIEREYPEFRPDLDEPDATPLVPVNVPIHDLGRHRGGGNRQRDGKAAHHADIAQRVEHG